MIQPISPISFKSIETTGGRFTPVQEEIKKDIVEKLSKPVCMGQNIDKFYEESSSGFRLLPIAHDKVELHRLTNVIRNKKNEILRYEKAISEGIFDHENQFNPKSFIRKVKAVTFAQMAAVGAVALSLISSAIILAFGLL